MDTGTRAWLCSSSKLAVRGTCCRSAVNRFSVDRPLSSNSVQRSTNSRWIVPSCRGPLLRRRFPPLFTASIKGRMSSSAGLRFPSNLSYSQREVNGNAAIQKLLKSAGRRMLRINAISPAGFNSSAYAPSRLKKHNAAIHATCPLA